MHQSWRASRTDGLQRAGGEWPRVRQLVVQRITRPATTRRMDLLSIPHVGEDEFERMAREERARVLAAREARDRCAGRSQRHRARHATDHRPCARAVSELDRVMRLAVGAKQFGTYGWIKEQRKAIRRLEGGSGASSPDARRKHDRRPASPTSAPFLQPPDAARAHKASYSSLPPLEKTPEQAGPLLRRRHTAAASASLQPATLPASEPVVGAAAAAASAATTEEAGEQDSTFITEPPAAAAAGLDDDGARHHRRHHHRSTAAASSAHPDEAASAAEAAAAAVAVAAEPKPRQPKQRRRRRKREPRALPAAPQGGAFAYSARSPQHDRFFGILHHLERRQADHSLREMGETPRGAYLQACMQGQLTPEPLGVVRRQIADLRLGCVW